MAHLDDLPPDQRAVLGLLLKQGRGYEQIAGMLRLEPRAIRERALDALDALGPQDDALAAEDQDLVADRLLGQADGPAREEAEALLAESPAARAWARAVVAALEPLAPAGSLPEVPDDADDPEPVAVPDPIAVPDPVAAPAPAPASAPAPAAEAAPSAGGDPDATADAAPVAAGPSATDRARERPAGTTSRLGTALIVGAALVAIVAIVIALNGGFGGSDDSASDAAAPVASTPAVPTPATGTSTGTATTARVQQQIELTPPNQGSEALGVAQLVQAGSSRGLAVAAQDLPAGYYAVWLYNSADDAAFLGFAPQVAGSGTNRGQLQGLSQSLPRDISKYRQVTISRQVVTSANREQTPSRPGTIVLRGTLR